MDRPTGGIVIRWLLPVFGAIGVAAAIGAVRSSDLRVTTYAQSAAGVSALTLAAGLGLVAVGAFAVWDRTGGAVGQLAIVAGLGWLAPLWTGWAQAQSSPRVSVSWWHRSCCRPWSTSSLSTPQDEHRPDGVGWLSWPYG